MYTIVTPAYRNGAPCPHADGYKQCREGNSRECNKPVYDEVEETGESPGQPPQNLNETDTRAAAFSSFLQSKNASVSVSQSRST